MYKKNQESAREGENANPGPVEELLIKLLAILISWLLTKLSTDDGRRKFLGE